MEYGVNEATCGDFEDVQEHWELFSPKMWKLNRRKLEIRCMPTIARMPLSQEWARLRRDSYAQSTHHPSTFPSFS